jgi:AAA ATPase domain
MMKKPATPAIHLPRPAMQSAIFGRGAELDELRSRLAGRRSFLLHGPAGVGKTLLLRALTPALPCALWSEQTQTPQALYRNLAEALLLARDHRVLKACCAGVPSLRAKTAIAIRGIVRDGLRNSGYLVVLDQLARPSQALAAAVRELIIDCSVPVVAVSRSAHMEDAGFVLPLFPDRTERYALRNFDSETARGFSSWRAEQEGLTAGNLATFLAAVVAYSEGNPGAITHMIRMAATPKYSYGGQIKAAPLYIDFKIAMVNQ